MSTPRPVLAGDPSILIVPSASHHSTELIPLARALELRGYRTVVGATRRDSMHTTPLSDALGIRSPYTPSEIGSAVAGFSAVLTMEDWGEPGDIVAAARDAGAMTFTKVDGASDFFGADAAQQSKPYRTAEYILCQGRNDFDLIDGRRFIVGSTRLEQAYRAGPVPISGDSVLINATSQIREHAAQQRAWLESAVAACHELDVPFTVTSQTSVGESLNQIPHVSTISTSDLLPGATVLVSRFSTVPFEAMALGVPFVYHNPHGERVSTFAHGGDAFRTTANAGQLAEAIREARGWRGDYRARSASFFARQVDINPEVASEDRAADVIYGLLG